MPLSFSYDEGSSTGSGRLGKFSHDSFIIKKICNKNGINQLVAAVADDSGQFPGGTYASDIAIEMVTDFFASDFFSEMKGAGEDPVLEELIKDLFKRINTAVYSRGVNEGQMVRLSLTAIFMVEDKLYAGHVGTNRMLKILSDSNNQLTQDQSWFSRAIKRGMKVDEAFQRDAMGIKVPTLGLESSVECQFILEILKIDDCIAIFTDGISEFISNQEVQVIINSVGNIPDACKRLVSISEERGLRDNATIVAFSVKQKEESPKKSFEKIVEKGKGQQKFLSCSTVYYFILIVLLLSFGVSAYVGVKFFKKTLDNLQLAGGSKRRIPSRSPVFQAGEKAYLVKDKDTIDLNIFKLNGKTLDKIEDKFEVSGDYNNLEILPIMDKNTFTLSIKINSRSSYQVYEGSSRNRIQLFEDNLKVFLTKGAYATFRPDEAEGVLTLEVSGLASPVMISFEKQNMIIKVSKDL